MKLNGPGRKKLGSVRKGTSPVSRRRRESYILTYYGLKKEEPKVPIRGNFHSCVGDSQSRATRFFFLPFFGWVGIEMNWEGRHNMQAEVMSAGAA